VKDRSRFTVLVLAVLLVGASACRLPVFFPEFQVDPGQDGVYGASLDKNGEFVVSWEVFNLVGGPDVYGRRFSTLTTPLAPAFPVNADTGPVRERAAIARDAEGRFIIVWVQDDVAIWGQRWQADGTPIGDNFQVNTSTPTDLQNPRVAADPSGNFVVTWSTTTHAVARRFDSNGAPLDDEFEVAEYTTGTQYATGVAMSATNFIVTWTGEGADGDGPFGRLFDGSGAPITSDFRLNSTPLSGSGTLGFPTSVAMNAAGNFVVVWSDYALAPQAHHLIRGRRFEGDGESLGDDFLIREDTTVDPAAPRVASDAAGNFLIVWDEHISSGSDYDVFGRFYDVGGNTASDIFEVNQTTGGQQARPEVSLGDDGAFVVAFASGAGLSHELLGVKGGTRASPSIVMDPLPTADGPGGPNMGNGVFEPGETQVLETAWINDTNEAVESIFGQASSFTGPPGADYTINDDQALYDVLPTGVPKSCIQENDCYSVTVSNPATRPVQHWDAVFQEQTNMSLPHTWVLHLGESFPDVPPANGVYRFVETIFHKGVTGGCAGGGYCPTNPVTRAQMAVFLMKAKLGSAHVPPPCTGTVFADVPCTGGPFDPWIEELASLQITGGCGGGNYCPGATVTRQQMAVFLLKAFEGSSYDPPDCAGVFDDVPCTPGTGFSDWIEELAGRGITVGCSAAPPLYCPTNPNNRGQMAVFLVKTFGLVLYGG
jgi:hypothetical protein